MRDRKGFTLIELLAVVVILGLVILVAVPFFTGSMNVFRDDYYKNLEGNVESSGKEFFSDNRIYLPHRLLESSIVDVNTLQTQKYIENFKDYNGTKCEEKESYVIVIKKGRDKYEYKSCVKCESDDYDNTIDNNYCSDAWKDGFTQITFTDAPTLYVHVGTQKNVLREKLKVYPTISRCSKIDITCSSPLVSVSAEGEDGIEPIYPKDIDKVNTNKVGIYEVEYQYENHLDTVKGKVIVFGGDIERNGGIGGIYNTDGDGMSFKKTNNYVLDTVTAAAVQKTSTYNPDDPDDWAQQTLTTTFRHTFIEGETPPGLKVARYQRYYNNRWEDYCTDINGDNNECVKVETREMDEDVKFRYVDSLGNVSTESRVYNFRIDHTNPTCELSYKAPDAENTWYKSDIEFTFGSKTQPDSSKPYSTAKTVNSGELRYGISTGSILGSNKASDKQTTDTKGTMWYGYVEDKANNFTYCSTDSEIKRDTVKPSCELQFAGTAGNSGWFKKGTVTISFKSATDATSDVATYGFSSNAGGDKSVTRSNSTGASGVTYTGYVKDVAGHANTCTKTLYLDADDPTCSTSKSNLNTPDGVTVSFSCDNNTGGTKTNCPSQRTGIKSSDTYTVTDAAGNSNTCSVTVYNKQQKRTKSCSYGYRCSNASRGCEQWNECAHNECGTHDCNCSNCYTGSNTCQGGNVFNGTYSCSTFIGGYDESMTASWGYDTCSQCYSPGIGSCPYTGWSCQHCTKNYTYSSCATGSNTCAYGCDQCPNSCRISLCGCEYYHRDIGNCGCESWNGYGSWGDDSSCSPNGEHESSNHSTMTNCRTVYY